MQNDKGPIPKGLSVNNQQSKISNQQSKIPSPSPTPQPPVQHFLRQPCSVSLCAHEGVSDEHLEAERFQFRGEGGVNGVEDEAAQQAVIVLGDGEGRYIELQLGEHF